MCFMTYVSTYRTCSRFPFTHNFNVNLLPKFIEEVDLVRYRLPKWHINHNPSKPKPCSITSCPITLNEILQQSSNYGDAFPPKLQRQVHQFYPDWDNSNCFFGQRHIISPLLHNQRFIIEQVVSLLYHSIHIPLTPKPNKKHSIWQKRDPINIKRCPYPMDKPIHNVPWWVCPQNITNQRVFPEIELYLNIHDRELQQSCIILNDSVQYLLVIPPVLLNPLPSLLIN
ncbi:hypothetical protein RND81_08G112700 [Saponaria officinalis]|uniref:Uncharacterized protein n=1 Tax=Saponaria officinalis TaxID=3572 RepID=A0AAW1J688_SAPOF